MRKENYENMGKKIDVFALFLFVSFVGFFVQKSRGCIIPERRTKFGDFAKRADVVVRAQVLSIDLPNARSRYKATFRVSGLFTDKTDDLAVGRTLKLGYFGDAPTCTPVKPKEKFILFLKIDAKLGSEVKYSLRYNPIPVSERNVFFFGKLLAGRISGRRVMQSGCLALSRPRNGKIQCTSNRVRCRVVCSKGFVLIGGPAGRKCSILTGHWSPSRMPRCVEPRETVRNTKASTSVNVKQSVIRRLWSPAKRRPLPNGIEGLEEEEEEEEEDVLPVLLPKKIIPKKAKSPPEPTTTLKPFAVSEKVADEELTEITNLPLGTETQRRTATEETSKISSNSVRTIVKPAAEQPLLDKTGDEWETSDGLLYRPLMALNETIYGCPTYSGNVRINSRWLGGFGGLAYVPHLPRDLIGGWLLRLSFNTPVASLETYTVDFYAAAHSGMEYCLAPKYYTVDLYMNQALTVSFNGKLPANSPSNIRGTAQLLGICNTEHVAGKNVGLFLPLDNTTSSLEDAWTRNRTKLEAALLQEKFAIGQDNNDDLSLATSTGPTAVTPKPKANSNDIDISRCSPSSPNGSRPPGGETEPNWNRSQTITRLDYNEILHKSIIFYEAQRSGNLPTNNRIPWRGNADLKDGCSINKDLTGGWYNGAGNVKTTFLIAYTTTVLTWGAMEYEQAYTAAGEKENLLLQIRWAVEFLIKCHTAPNELIVQIGNYVTAATNWNRAEDSSPQSRVVYKVDQEQPGSDVAAEVAASLAAASILYKSIDRNFSLTCLQHAKTLFNFADRYRGEYSSVIPHSATKYYSWNGAEDELAWAATWLYKATDDDKFLRKAENIYEQLVTGSVPDLFYWDDKTRGVATLLAKLTNKATYTRAVISFANWLQDSAYKIESGLVWLHHWAPTMHAANAAFLSLQAADITQSSEQSATFLQFAQKQMDILYGTKRQGFVVGVGPNAPSHPHHRGSTCPSAPAVCAKSAIYNSRNAHILYGALVAGPGRFGRYNDVASDYIYNEVAIDFNAGFQSLAAGLKLFDMKSTQGALTNGA